MDRRPTHARSSLPTLAAALLLGLGATSAAHGAEPGPAGRAALFQNLLDCKAKGGAEARLACYDAAVSTLGAAESKGDIVVVDREQGKAVRRQAFGLNLPSLSIFERGDRPEAIDAVTLKIENATRMADGKWLLRLEGGQVWRQIDTEELSRPPRPGSPAVIKRAALGSFRLNVGGTASIRVHRDD